MILRVEAQLLRVDIVEFLSSLPRTAMGKIDRGKLEGMSRGK
jgi:acyl-coenzyme A synthetase/AMP-(fatty) acid ligase